MNLDVSLGEVWLDDYAERWLATRVTKRGRPLEASTRYGYERLLHRNVLPKRFLGAIRMRAVTPQRVEEWYGTVVKEKGQDQAAKSYRFLHAVFATAKRSHVIGQNPFDIVGAGQENAPERPMVDKEIMLDLIDAMVPRYRIVVSNGGLGGLRTGESLGLRVEDVDPLQGCVHIRVNALEVPGHGRIVKDPKTRAGVRAVVMPKLAMQAIEWHVATFAPAADGSLITDPRGRPAHRSRVSTAWMDAKKTVGVDPGLRVHDLRHHAGTMMARMPGITTRELMARIGHESPRAALRYQHATEERDRAVAAFLDGEYAEVERSSRAPIRVLRRAHPE
jgi:integrase